MNERTLPWLKLFAAPIDGTFGQCGGRQFGLIHVVKCNFHAVSDALDLFDDGIGQRE